jgi:hypothetical protein
MLRFLHLRISFSARGAERLLVDYIRDVLLQPEAADWFRTWWTRARGRYCLAHAGYGGSNIDMGIEVDWRDVKGLVWLECQSGPWPNSSLCTQAAAVWERSHTKPWPRTSRARETRAKCSRRPPAHAASCPWAVRRSSDRL